MCITEWEQYCCGKLLLYVFKSLNFEIANPRVQLTNFLPKRYEFLWDQTQFATLLFSRKT